MKDINRIQDIVKECLENEPETRNSDSLLYVDVCNKINPAAMHMSFGEVMCNMKALGLPKFETVRRSRQKLQEHNEDLRACDEVTEGRYENWKAVREYVLQ